MPKTWKPQTLPVPERNQEVESPLPHQFMPCGAKTDLGLPHSSSIPCLTSPAEPTPELPRRIMSRAQSLACRAVLTLPCHAVRKPACPNHRDRIPNLTKHYPEKWHHARGYHGLPCQSGAVPHLSHPSSRCHTEPGGPRPQTLDTAPHRPHPIPPYQSQPSQHSRSRTGP